MKNALLRAAALACIFGASASAQWRSETYPLKAGWNAIWLPGDATYQTVEQHLAAVPAITQVWRWDAQANSIQFGTSPDELFSSTDQWAVWNRADPTRRSLAYLTGNSPYLVYASAPSSWTIKYQVKAPAAPWQTTGANLLGFPAAGNGSASSPTFQAYFASLIFGGARGLPASAKIFKYAGGELVRNVNPMAVPPTERMDPRAAYWISLPSATDYTAPVEYELAGGAIDFGRTLDTLSLGVKNRTTSAITLNLSLETSEAAPAGQAAIAGAVPLSLRTTDPATGNTTETSLPAGASIQVPASGTAAVLLALNRSQMSQNPLDSFASILSIADSANLSRVRLPVRAQPSSPAGLWACSVAVQQVSPLGTAAGAGDGVGRGFQLNYLVHISGDGAARLLRTCFIGQLKSTGNPIGIAVKESDVYAKGEAQTAPRRGFSSIIPASQPVVESSTPYSAQGTLSWRVTHAYTDPVNPFAHAYHPDHDNRTPDFRSARQEAPTLVRDIAMEFTPAPPARLDAAASLAPSWGKTILGGNYAESITGLNKAPLSARGVFTMRRIAEIPTIKTN